MPLRIRFKYIFFTIKIILALCFISGVLDMSLQADTYSYTYGIYKGLDVGPGTVAITLVGLTISNFITPEGLYIITTLITTSILIYFVEKYCNEKLLLYLLFSSPIFTIFTLGFNKEAITIILYYGIYKILSKSRISIFVRGTLFTVILGLLYFIKVASLIPLIFLLFFLKFRSSNFFKMNKKILFYLSPLILILLTAVIINVLQDQYLSIEQHINFKDNTSRNYGLLKNKMDIIKHIPYGIYYFLFGHNFFNLFKGIGLIFLVENLLIIKFIYKYLNISNFIIPFNNYAVVVFYFLVTIISIYPLLFFNATTSMRYKIPSILCFIYILISSNQSKIHSAISNNENQ